MESAPAGPAGPAGPTRPVIAVCALRLRLALVRSSQRLQGPLGPLRTVEPSVTISAVISVGAVIPIWGQRTRCASSAPVIVTGGTSPAG